MFNRKEIKKEIVSDLDKILTETVSFKLHGKIFRISPITSKQFFKYTLALDSLHKISGEIDAQELINRYHDLMKQVIPEIEREDIAKCSQAQIAGLFRLVINTITGYQEDLSLEESEKKKNKLA